MHPRYCIECSVIHGGFCPQTIIRIDEADQKHWNAIEMGLLLPDMEFD